MADFLLVECAQHPLSDVEVRGMVHRDWVAVEQIRHQYEVAIVCKLVCDQLRVVGAVAEYIGNSGMFTLSVGSRCRQRCSATLTIECQK